jgi:hypothetical protein
MYGVSNGRRISGVASGNKAGCARRLLILMTWVLVWARRQVGFGLFSEVGGVVYVVDACAWLYKHSYA